uniref:Uncharacterized protein n=1 Tax=Leersia perrieri TaxID=77586 RepID=A0A0D9V1L3_9ORYZ
MASKIVLAFVSLVLLLVVVTGNELGHAVPLKRGHGLGWMNGVKGSGSPSGMQQPSAATTARHARLGEDHEGHYYVGEEGKSVITGPSISRVNRPSPP